MIVTTLVLLKPDILQRDLVGRVISRFEEKGLAIIGLKMFRFSKSLVREHYAHVADKPFYAELEAFMTRGPSIAIAVSGAEAVETVRLMIGTTKASSAAPGTIRGDFGLSSQRNIVHASDSAETARAELTRFFEPAELFDYPDLLEDVIYSSQELGPLRTV
ncbi:MAG TPA: nucleoside-diphosphate kinase [Galbitalea sp.]|jgi:nucleoside-diphosphate kinase